MWQLKDPQPVKLIFGILAANHQCLHTAIDALSAKFGRLDFSSDVWPFDKTDYYNEQTGSRIQTNKLEQKLAKSLALPLPRPVNLDPGIIEPSKLVLATTKNYSHRIYIGRKIYAEVTLIFDKGKWCSLEHTYPDYKQQYYFDFFSKVRERLLEQLKIYNAGNK